MAEKKEMLTCLVPSSWMRRLRIKAAVAECSRSELVRKLLKEKLFPKKIERTGMGPEQR